MIVGAVVGVAVQTIKGWERLMTWIWVVNYTVVRWGNIN
jgi:hypothetical protein